MDNKENKEKMELNTLLKASGKMLEIYWIQRNLIPNGVWIILLTYCMVVFGSPMPPEITWLEIAMGCGLLIGSALLIVPVYREIKQQRAAKWIFGLTVILFLAPLCSSLVRGNTWPDIVRDIFPFLFLLMVPILLTFSASSNNLKALRMLVAIAIVLVGICTAIAFFVGAINLFGSLNELASKLHDGLAQSEVTKLIIATDEEKETTFIKLYDPAMFFAALFLSGWGVILMINSWARWLPGMILTGVGVTISYCFMMSGLRSYTVFFVLAIMYASLAKWKESGFYLRLLPVISLICILWWPQIQQILHLLWIKQQAVGTNGKADEWWAVITTIYASPQTLLFGIGWGGVFENPILGVPTRFTHSILSFYLLKTGFIGLGILLTIIWLLLSHFQKPCISDRQDISGLILLVSCLPPLLVGVLFEPTYKIISYGIILALLILTIPVCINPKEESIR